MISNQNQFGTPNSTCQQRWEEVECSECISKPVLSSENQDNIKWMSKFFPFSLLLLLLFLLLLFHVSLRLFDDGESRARGWKEDLDLLVFFCLTMSDEDIYKKWRNIYVELFLIEARISQRINRKEERGTEILCDLHARLKTQQCEGQMDCFDIIGKTKRGESEGSIYLCVKRLCCLSFFLLLHQYGRISKKKGKTFVVMKLRKRYLQLCLVSGRMRSVPLYP